jgi:hypothetical protein
VGGPNEKDRQEAQEAQEAAEWRWAAKMEVQAKHPGQAQDLQTANPHRFQFLQEPIEPQQPRA